MAAPQHNAPNLVRAAKILAQVGEELAFVGPGILTHGDSLSMSL